MGAARRSGPAGTVGLGWAVHSPAWVRPAVRAAAAAAVLAALVSCGASRSPVTSSTSRATPHRNAQAHGAGIPADHANAAYSWVSVNGLNSVAAASAHSVWAVGSAATGKPLIEHWNGQDWRQVPSASPRGATESLLNSVAATGSTAWAVGYYNTGTTIKTLIERRNGRGWVQVASPNPGGVHGSYLRGVAATGSSNAWAVGYYSTGTTTKPLIERWTGRGWAQVASPNPGDAGLKSVAAAGKSSAWAVGDYYAPGLRPLIERWDGRVLQHRQNDQDPDRAVERPRLDRGAQPQPGRRAWQLPVRRRRERAS